MLTNLLCTPFDVAHHVPSNIKGASLIIDVLENKLVVVVDQCCHQQKCTKMNLVQ